MVIFIQCGVCRGEAPCAYDEDDRPDIPEGWCALHPESQPKELYACSEDCALVLGYALSQSHPKDHIVERRVMGYTNA